jgi:L-lactate permease
MGVLVMLITVNQLFIAYLTPSVWHGTWMTSVVGGVLGMINGHVVYRWSKYESNRVWTAYREYEKGMQR